MGICFQTEPRGETDEIIIHVRMLDRRNLQQQEALENLICVIFWTESICLAPWGARCSSQTTEPIIVSSIT
jgi:hypothetical protein